MDLGRRLIIRTFQIGVMAIISFITFNYLILGFGVMNYMLSGGYSVMVRQEPRCSLRLMYRNDHLVTQYYVSGDNNITMKKPANYRCIYDQVNDSYKIYNHGFPYEVYGFRCLKDAVIGSSESGYFVFNHARREFYLTSQYDHWVNYLHKLHIGPDTRLYPGPFLVRYAKQGWLTWNSVAPQRTQE